MRELARPVDPRAVDQLTRNAHEERPHHDQVERRHRGRQDQRRIVVDQPERVDHQIARDDARPEQERQQHHEQQRPMEQRSGPRQSVRREHGDPEADRRTDRGDHHADHQRAGDHSTREQLHVRRHRQLPRYDDQPAGPGHGLRGGQARHDHDVQRERHRERDQRQHHRLAQPADRRRLFLPHSPCRHDREYTPCSPTRCAKRLATRTSTRPTTPLNRPAAAPYPKSPTSRPW